MVDLPRLAARARRASEWGRVRAAARVALVILPFALAGLLAGVPPDRIGGITAALLLAAIALRWWGKPGARAVRAGLGYGALPMAASYLTLLVGGACDVRAPFTLCGSLCIVAALAAGIGTMIDADRSARGAGRTVTWAPTALIASLTAALGCVGLGLGGMVAVLASLLAGTCLARLPLGRRA